MHIQYESNSSPGPFSEEVYDELVSLLRIDNPGLEMDASYVDFAKRHNGGRPLDLSFVASDKTRWRVDVFLHFCDSPELNAIDTHHHVLEFLDDVEDQLTCSLLPFGIVGGGNLLCFDHTRDEKHPEVVIYLMESCATLFVSPSFQDFLKTCAQTTEAAD